MSRYSPIYGGCHCGNIEYQLDWPSGDTIIAKRRCGCTFCGKHGATWTSNRNAKLAIRWQDPGRVSNYRFGTATADFLVCSDCGVVAIASCVIDDSVYAVVNVNTFGDSHEFEVTESATDFDGEDLDDRLGRRKLNWIPSVELQAEF